jgi:hypothetical protein
MVYGVETLATTFEGNAGIGIHLFKITVAGAEMIVERSLLPDAMLVPVFLEDFDIDVGENLEKEHATEQRQQKLFVHDDC